MCPKSGRLQKIDVIDKKIAKENLCNKDDNGRVFFSLSNKVSIGLADSWHHAITASKQKKWWRCNAPTGDVATHHRDARDQGGNAAEHNHENSEAATHLL